MSSLFRARRAEESRSGGKMLRGRRPTPSASPYARPGASPAAAQSGSPRWLSGLISGAGRLISSVLPSYRSSSSPSSSSGYSSDEDANEADDECLQQFSNQRGNGFELVNKRFEGQLAIEPKSETKLVIEQLLKQETFSRDECDKLTKLIQSRVIDFPSSDVLGDVTEELQRTAGNDALPRALASHNQRTLPERNHYSSSKLNAFSNGSSLFEACTPYVCNKAVSEAKKWLEEKKSEAKPKYDSECGPCTLNTDMLQYGIEGERGSPVDMAKSYMKSLPPWRSPTFSGVGFKTPRPSGIRHYETSYETANHALPSSKGLKRDRLFLGDWDNVDESRQVRLKSIYDELEISKSKQSEKSAIVEHERFKSLSEADKRDLHCGDPRTDVTFRLPVEKDADANYQLERSNHHSPNVVLESGEAIREVHSTHEISVPNAPHGEPTKCLAEDQDHVKPPSQTMEEADNDSVPHDILASASALVENDENVLSEIKVITGNTRSVGSSDPDDTAKLNDVQTPTSTGVQTHVLSDGCFSQLNAISGIAEMNHSSDCRPQEGSSHMPNKANGAIMESSANCSEEVNEDCNHDAPSEGADTIMQQNGTKMKSIERMLTKTHAATSRRGKKAVVKSRRGRKT